MWRVTGRLRATVRQLYPLKPKLPYSGLRNSSSADINDAYIPLDNEPDVYKKLRKIIDAELSRRLYDPNRFQPISKREDSCDMPIEVCKADSKGRCLAVYRGCTVIKTSDLFLMYHQLFHYLKPHTVIELGTCGGGSAVWMADTLRLLDIPGHVYTMDLDQSLIEDNAKKIKPDNLTFLEGDCYKIEDTFTDDFLSKLPRPWVVIDDAHANIGGVLRYFHQYLKEGDYITVEDTNPYVPRDVCYMGTAFDSTTFIGPRKLEELKMFLSEYEEYYAVDSFLTDFFGYNCSWMWHGFIRRMK